MRQHNKTLLIYGMRTYLGREVARFGRAMGHRIVAVVDGQRPELDHPWMHGVQWTTERTPLEDTWPEGPPGAVIYCDTVLSGAPRQFRWVLADRPHQLAQRAAGMDRRPRFVLRSTVHQPLLPSRFTAEHHRGERLVTNTGVDTAVLRVPILYGPDRPDSTAAMAIAEGLRRIPLPSVRENIPPCLRVETAALAALRAALEPDLIGTFDPEEIARIGDVMIPQ